MNADEEVDSGTIEGKVRRIRDTGTIRTVDLFCGCGGLSLGFHSEGFQIVGGLDSDPKAMRSHARNFHAGDPDALARHARARDIRETPPEQFVRDLSLGEETPGAADVILGGPPCQAYARVGRAKLRHLAEDPDAFLDDPRTNLHLQYLEYVAAIQPVALLFENVPDAVNHRGHNVAREICEVLDDLGYTARYTLLNAAFYGVPQYRERLFVMAYHRELSTTVSFPRPTRHAPLGRGHRSVRSTALKNVPPPAQMRLPRRENYFHGLPEQAEDLPSAVTTGEAIGDLPAIEHHLDGRQPSGARRFDTPVEYARQPHSHYSELMRGWPGFEAPDRIPDHVIRYNPRDYETFCRMEPGDQYPEAKQQAMEIFRERLEELGDEAPEEGSEDYQKLRNSIVPPYNPDKFPNQWRKLDAEEPAHTVVAHLSRDTYSHIHYDDDQARTISVREAARLQSFPDGFVFEGPMGPAFRQIGNAVPPLLASALARQMRTELLASPAQGDQR